MRAVVRDSEGNGIEVAAVEPPQRHRSHPEDPVNQPDTMPAGYSQLCGHHVFLTDGDLLSVGGAWAT
ncbi:MAG TPA: hypothetical protein VFD82_08145 [Planctomycetota bacterium]|nr:hypothetical protein [Planctomycetota bacterium]